MVEDGEVTSLWWDALRLVATVIYLFALVSLPIVAGNKPCFRAKVPAILTLVSYFA